MLENKLFADLNTVDEKELLQFVLKNDILNLDDVKEAMRKKQKEEILRKHPYSIWQGKDGRWRTHIPDITQKSGRKLVVKSTEEKIYEALDAHYQNIDEATHRASITLRKLYPQWLEYKKLHTRAESYISRIDTDWRTYYRDTEIIDMPIKKLNKLTLDMWAHKLIQDYDMTKNKYYNVTVIMRQSLDYAVDIGLIPSNPMSQVKIDGKRMFRKVKKKPDATQVFSKEELDLIFPMAWEDFKNHTKVYELAPLAFLFQFQTGLRIGELCAVRYEDIETPNYIHIQRMLRRDTNQVVEHTKTEYGDRQVLLTETAKKIIACAKARQEELGVDSEGYIFSINGKPILARVIDDLYKKYCKKAGIIQKSSHKARKTYISSLLDAQVNINTIREIVGHSDERTTLGNYCFDRKAEDEKKILIEKALSI